MVRTKSRTRSMRLATFVRTVALSVGAFIWLGTVSFAVYLEHADAFVPPSPDREAMRIVQQCAREESDDLCYERVVPELYPEHAVPFVFDVVRSIRRIDTDYQFCHVLAHKLGDRVVQEDPDHWMQAMPLNPSDGMCSNGFLHGVINGRFRADVLDDEALEAYVPDFSRACASHDGWNPSSLDTGICVHGMGHLYVFITDANLRKALSLCERTSKQENGDYAMMCRDGVFMQIFQPLEPDDFLMIEQMPVKPSTTTVRQFCGMYSDNPEYEGACLRESWPYFREEIKTGPGVVKFCADQPNDVEEFNCYRTASVMVGRQSLSDNVAGVKICGAFPEKWQALCLKSVSIAEIEEDRNAYPDSIAICKSGNNPAIVHECLATLSERADFFFGDDVALKRRYCQALPEEFRTVCGY